MSADLVQRHLDHRAVIRAGYLWCHDCSQQLPYADLRGNTPQPPLYGDLSLTGPGSTPEGREAAREAFRAAREASRSQA